MSESPALHRPRRTEYERPSKPVPVSCTVLRVPGTVHRSRDLLILVEQAAELVPSSDAVRLARRVLGELAEGSGLAEHVVWPAAVVMLGVLDQYGCGMPLVGDEDAVEELAADGADEAFDDCVGPRARAGLWMVRMSVAVKTAPNAAVNLASRSSAYADRRIMPSPARSVLVNEGLLGQSRRHDPRSASLPPVGAWEERTRGCPAGSGLIIPQSTRHTHIYLKARELQQAGEKPQVTRSTRRQSGVSSRCVIPA